MDDFEGLPCSKISVSALGVAEFDSPSLEEERFVPLKVLFSTQQQMLLEDKPAEH